MTSLTQPLAHQSELEPLSQRRVMALLIGLGVLNLLPMLLPQAMGEWPLSVYLPIHSLLEIIAVAIAAMIFAIGWEYHRQQITLRSVVLTSAFFAVAWLDLSHLLSYQGMPDYVTPSDPAKAINFWLAARLCAAASLLFIVLPIAKRPASVRYRMLGLLIAALVTLALHVWFLGFPSSVPVTFLSDSGLTTLKISLEYLIIALNILTVVVMIRFRQRLNHIHVTALLGAVVTMAYSELYFTLYHNVSDVYNALGHVMKLMSYAFLYRAIIFEAVTDRYRRLQDSRAELQATLAAVPDLLLDVDKHGIVHALHADQQHPLLAVVTTDPRRLLGQPLPEPLQATLRSALAQAEARQGSSDALQIAQYTADQVLWLQLVAVYKQVNNADGRPARFMVALRDITSDTLAQATQQINALAFHTREAILITDDQQRIVRVNPAFSEITGYAEPEVVGRKPSMLRSGLHDRAFYTHIWDMLNQQGAWTGEIYNRRKNGEIYPQHIVINSIKNHEGRITHYVACFSDISEHKAAQAHIHHLAYFDALTDLPNRRLLLDRIAQAQRDSAHTQQFSALLFIDLDYFKRLNDSLGHSQGDELLRQLAQRIQTCLRSSDTLARPGGDEFILLAGSLGQDQAHAVQAAQQLGEKVLELIRQPFDLQGSLYRITASIGIHLFNDQSLSIDDLMAATDIAMYHAKEQGRNQVHFFEVGMQQRLMERNRLEEALDNAIAQQQFVLFYQPKINVRQELIGYEALIRWQHPERGLLSPLEFIGLAESTGQILAIGKWVLEQACQDSVVLAQQHGKAVPIAVNISERQVRQVDFADQVLRIVSQAGVAPSVLELEITESILHEDLLATRNKLAQLHQHGIRIALDDFGTGYSSLAYLKQFPLDVIKIDQSFVRNLLSDDKDHAIVRAILALAQALGLDTVAEGVETEAHFQTLLGLGCPFFQGYFISKPQPLQVLLSSSS